MRTSLLSGWSTRSTSSISAMPAKGSQRRYNQIEKHNIPWFSRPQSSIMRPRASAISEFARSSLAISSARTTLRWTECKNTRFLFQARAIIKYLHTKIIIIRAILNLRAQHIRWTSQHGAGSLNWLKQIHVLKHEGLNSFRGRHNNTTLPRLIKTHR